jgi:SNF2 family DNA or RNA helicase
VAPVYLRRNQEDVLTELPDLVQIDEWEEFGRVDGEAYRDAVMSGNFMAMRRAAFADPEHSAKLQRLVEIADEAGDNDHKVVVFSYFRDVLATVHAALGPRAFGPLTGDVPPTQRQALVDEFTAADGHAVLVSQIQAGGVGLNMQAASVVVLCEPQVKPTMEFQAIARAHRMGQVRKVQVHRLLIENSVDQRMLEILDSKTHLFDAYARRSDLADSTPDAVDISEVELARRVVAAEQERLAVQAMSHQTQA